MDLSTVWFIGTVISWIVLGSFVFTLVFSQLIYALIRWIDDYESYRPKILIQKLFPAFGTWYCNGYNDVEEFATKTFAVGFLGGILCAGWPLTVPIAIGIACSFGLRGFVRFKKKVNKALNKIN